MSSLRTLRFLWHEAIYKMKGWIASPSARNDETTKNITNKKQK
jgi:hypothetical protein